MKEIESIKQALAAGPTPGEWAHDADCSIVFSNDGDEVAVLERNPTGNYRRQVFFNGEYIAACNPDAMSKVLAHIEAQQAEIEQLRAQRGEPENIDPTGSNLPAEQANTPEVTSQGQVSVPALWRYRDSEQCIKPMDGYTPGEGWTPLYAAPQPERKHTEAEVQELMEFARHYAADTFSSATLEDKIRRSLAAPATAPDEIERLRKDAERYQWLAEYLVSDDESYDDAIVAATTVAELDYVTDAAMKETP
jgi:hypothetical protein